jgi:hypothetical protein
MDFDRVAIAFQAKRSHLREADSCLLRTIHESTAAAGIDFC